MTDQEINVAIARHCGWKQSAKGWWSHPTLPDNGGAEPNPPDYLGDLNAMHEAENSLFDCLKDAYGELIIDGVHGPHWRFDAIHSTARQRAEAFLRTIGKWKE